MAIPSGRRAPAPRGERKRAEAHTDGVGECVAAAEVLAGTRRALTDAGVRDSLRIVANVALPRRRLWAHTVLVWFVVQTLWLALVLSLREGPGSGGLRGVLVAAAILVPPLGVGAAFFRWRRRRTDRLSEAEARLASSALTTRGGHRLVPAGGHTPDDPIVCLEPDPARIAAAEREYLRERVSASAVVVGQALRRHRGRMLDVLTVEVDGIPCEFHFDVTRSASFAA